jgi:adenosylcobinamide-GDP ribazoletransferase
VLGGSRSPSWRAGRWFPLVGLALGGVTGGIWWSLRHWLSPLTAAAAVVAVDLVLTGMLHFDGLADAGDGLLAPMDRTRRLEVMRDPHVGAFGVVSVAAVMLLRWSALSSLVALPLLVPGLWCLSRSGMTLALATLPYARSEGGLASAFGTGRHDERAGLVAAGGAGGLVGAAAVVLARPAGSLVGGAAAAAAAVVGFGLVIELGRRRLGGYTGDVLGAAGVVGETLGLVVASAHW